MLNNQQLCVAFGLTQVAMGTNRTHSRICTPFKEQLLTVNGKLSQHAAVSTGAKLHILTTDTKSVKIFVGQWHVLLGAAETKSV
jgi:hypothetical protein